jgi:hypothetical protein
VIYSAAKAWVSACSQTDFTIPVVLTRGVPWVRVVRVRTLGDCARLRTKNMNRRVCVERLATALKQATIPPFDDCDLEKTTASRTTQTTVLLSWRSSSLHGPLFSPLKGVSRIRVVSCHTMPLLSDSGRTKKHLYCRVSARLGSSGVSSWVASRAVASRE